MQHISQLHSQWHAFLQMHGYGKFVWPAYGIVFTVLILNAILPIIQHRRLRKSLKLNEFNS